MPETPERLRKLQEQAEKATEARTGECGHNAASAVFVWRLRTGERRLYDGCSLCGAQVGRRSIPHAGHDIETIPIGIDERTVNPPCQRCGAFGTQLHHWAPKSLFGEAEADRWPTAYLCIDCHDFWHRTTRTGAHQQRGA